MSAVVEVALIHHGLPNRVGGVVAEADQRLDGWRELVAEPNMQAVLAEFRHRAITVVGRVAAGTRDGIAAVLCHGRVIGACAEKAVGDVRLSLGEPDYSSITRMAIECGGQWKLRTNNEIHHIERLATGREERNGFSR